MRCCNGSKDRTRRCELAAELSAHATPKQTLQRWYCTCVANIDLAAGEKYRVFKNVTGLKVRLAVRTPQAQ